MSTPEDETVEFLKSALENAGETLIVDSAKHLLKSTLDWFKGWWDWATTSQRKRVVQRIHDALSHYRGTGVRPNPVPLKVFKRWVERASVEDSKMLQEAWSNLLANAADPRDSRKQGHSSFMEIMSQLDTPDCMVLLAVYRLQERADTGGDNRFFGGEELEESFDTIGYEREPTREELTLAKQNLSRLGLCELQPLIPTRSEDGAQITPVEPREICITEFGRRFYEAVRAPSFEKT